MTLEQVERQIYEMWDAVNCIPDGDPDKAFAAAQAAHTEDVLRERLRRYTDPVAFCDWVRKNADPWGDEWIHEKPGSGIKQFTTSELFQIYIDLSN